MTIQLKGWRTHLTALATLLAGAIAFLVHVAGYLPQLDPHMSLEAVVLALVFAYLRAITDTPQGKDRAGALIAWVQQLTSQKDVIDRTLTDVASFAAAAGPRGAKIAEVARTAETVADRVITDANGATGGATGDGADTLTADASDGADAPPAPPAAAGAPSSTPPTVGGSSA